MLNRVRVHMLKIRIADEEVTKGEGSENKDKQFSLSSTAVLYQ